MRQKARNHFLYLRRRVEDFPDEGQPVPRWTELDYQAVSSMLRELGTLQRFYQDTVPLLRERNIPIAIPSGDEDLGSVYDLELKQSRARTYSSGLVLFLAGLIIGGFVGEMWTMLG